MEEGYFDLDCNSNIWIYGAGEKGKEYCIELQKQGYKVVGFLDEHLNETEKICGLCIYHLGNFVCTDKDRAIIILSLRNGMEQERVAKELVKLGFNKLLYLPMKMEQSLFDRRMYRENYARLCCYNFANIKKVPLYSKNDTNIIVINKSNGKISFWCPIVWLHSFLECENEIKKRWKIDIDISNYYRDKRIEEIYSYRRLFCFLEKGEADISDYMKMLGRITEEQQKSFIEDRKELYAVFEQAYKYDMSFFTDSPSLCTWNNNGYFNMYDGMHRAQYLMSKGYREVPILVTEKDFLKYKNMSNNNI